MGLTGRVAPVVLAGVLLAGCGDDGCEAGRRFTGTVEVVDAGGRAVVVRTPDGVLSGLLASEVVPDAGDGVTGRFVAGTLVLDP